MGVRCCFQVIENCVEKGIPTGTCACLIAGSNRCATLPLPCLWRTRTPPLLSAHCTRLPASLSLSLPRSLLRERHLPGDASRQSRSETRRVQSRNGAVLRTRCTFAQSAPPSAPVVLLRSVPSCAPCASCPFATSASATRLCCFLVRVRSSVLTPYNVRVVIAEH